MRNSKLGLCDVFFVNVTRLKNTNPSFNATRLYYVSCHFPTFHVIFLYGSRLRSGSEDAQGRGSIGKVKTSGIAVS